MAGVEDGAKLTAKAKRPRQLVSVAKREGVATTGAVDQVTRDFEPGQDLPDPRDIVADFFGEQCGV